MPILLKNFLPEPKKIQAFSVKMKITNLRSNYQSQIFAEFTVKIKLKSKHKISRVHSSFLGIERYRVSIEDLS